MTRRSCPKCKSHLIKEIKDSEVFGVTDKHVYSRIEKSILCLVCGYRSKTDWGISSIIPKGVRVLSAFDPVSLVEGVQFLTGVSAYLGLRYFVFLDSNLSLTGIFQKMLHILCNENTRDGRPLTWAVTVPQ